MTVIPKGSTVLVTGFTGYIGSHVTQQLLEAGYTVRGTTRSATKATFLREKFTREYGEGRLEVVEIPDVTVEGALDEAIKGVSGVAHVASDVSMSTNVDEVVGPVVRGTLSVLRAAAATPSVKRFVLTSSSTAAGFPALGVEYTRGEDSWNDVSAEALASAEDDAGKGFRVYALSKTEGEKAAWKFVKEEKPGFVFNAVLPDSNLGPFFDPSTTPSTAGFPLAILSGQSDVLKGFPNQWFVDVRDTARLHVAALTLPSTDAPGYRLWGAAEPFTWNQLLGIVRKLRPDRDLPEHFAWETTPNLSKIDNARSTALLKELGREGWIGIEESVEGNIEGR
ncbi:hypothetical protein PLICRDRAFT_118643 [Plicaturopsis crispa FD-325 SS-3]|uniref:NAD-dependent epimerase/dehydratase domain-containing protein n=1 Tax=Plicaturopsis crispa FD-325 SS-3 TaxID=944288 RepID=A0A0C9T3K7_PLICR|nr:hypothetical protein PLICRDRAFT_118643 [Plicaturopsis crispa FD-325 SS-3]